MKKKLGTLLVLLCTIFTTVQAQDTAEAKKQEQQENKIAHLMSEREQLVLEYQYLNQQNNSFWGNKSKKDLLNIIDTLKELIKKDSELIAAVKEASIKTIAKSTVENQRAGKQIVVDQRQINERIRGLQSQINTLQSQLKKRERTIADLQLQVKEADEKRYGKDKVITVLAVAAAILLLYAIILQVSLSKTKAKLNAKAKTTRRKAANQL
ncbi:hypothetical protein H7F15_04405 [Pontibacter sp. Tf4]|uniref:hypothetical protein n=1 Tax=Pontibacter sp. Tf4 TaxID=2761620 RepID=UPI001627FABA|nr:hypothetical protein [Pontibacter sp. Tf4]MBB6610271.1 hypothetical protein [Pontibacter sp. Tf4]